MAVTQQWMTLEAFLKLPEAKPALEYFDGVVTPKVSPNAEHSVLQNELVWRLNLAARADRAARIFPEVRTTYAAASRVPDIAVYRRARVRRKPTGEVAPDFFDPPDLAIEISSPGQSIADLTEKCRWYVANGVEIALLVLTRRRVVMRFTAAGPEQTLRGSDPIDVTSVVPAFQLTVTELFDSLHVG
jgi:Uma2 family endonuclease